MEMRLRDEFGATILRRKSSSGREVRWFSFRSPSRSPSLKGSIELQRDPTQSMTLPTDVRSWAT